MDEFITGERIQSVANLICLSYNRQFHTALHHPPLSQIPKCFLTDQDSIDEGIYRINTFPKAPIVFCYIDDVSRFIEEILDHITNPFVFVTHNGDMGITEEYYPLLNHPLLLHWFGQNPRLLHTNLTALPIGLENEMHAGDKYTILDSTIQKRISKENSLFTCFSVDTNPFYRSSILQQLKVQGFPIQTGKLPFTEFIETMASHQFAVTPMGNGVVTHRFWEALYLGVIPVVEKDLLYDYWPGLPIVQVETWNSLTLPSVSFKNPTPFLQLSYWKTLILSYQTS